MSSAGRVRRGDVVLLPIAFVSGRGTKVRPAVVVQNDNLNARLNSTVVAIITSTTRRAHVEPSQLLIDLSTPEGRQTGLLHDSTVKCEHLDTVECRDIQRKIGQLSPRLLQSLESCLKAALSLS
jgi:mRNA interferase MazF